MYEIYFSMLLHRVVWMDDMINGDGVEKTVEVVKEVVEAVHS
jgi:hypothetical protein